MAILVACVLFLLAFLNYSNSVHGQTQGSNGAATRTSPTGYLSTHVLDTTSGLPAAGMKIKLHRLSYGKSIVSSKQLIGEYITNKDGRVDQKLLDGDKFTAGTYELTFDVADYFEAKGNMHGACSGEDGEVPSIPFLSDVPIRFGVNDIRRHYHVPLLISPYSYSTYRGS